MANPVLTLAYGINFVSHSDFSAALAANGGLILLNLTPDAAAATYPAGYVTQYGIIGNAGPFTQGSGVVDYFNTVPNGTLTLGTYTPVVGTPGITYSPNTISTATRTTTVTLTTYGSFLNVMSTQVFDFTWFGFLGQGVASPPVFAPATFTGRWDQQVVTYTGDGTVGRAVATTFSLATGVVAIWVFRTDPSTTTAPCFRHSAMAGTILPPGTLDSTGGIMGFGVGGFSVTDDLLNLRDVNQLGKSYTAVVMRDSTSDNRYMQVGQYAGTNDVTRTITVSGGTRQYTSMWIFGRGGTGVFTSDLMTVGSCISWGLEAKPSTNMITAMGVGTFSIGNDNNVNNNAITYYYVCFAIPVGNAIRNIFQSLKTNGTGAPVVVSLAFTPAFVMVSNIDGVAAPNTTWRGPTQAGAHSNFWNGADSATDGIQVLGAASTTLGISAAPNGKEVDGFAMASSGSAGVGSPLIALPIAGTPPFSPGTPIPYVRTGGYSIQWLLEQFELKYRDEEHL